MSNRNKTKISNKGNSYSKYCFIILFVMLLMLVSVLFQLNAIKYDVTILECTMSLRTDCVEKYNTNNIPTKRNMLDGYVEICSNYTTTETYRIINNREFIPGDYVDCSRECATEFNKNSDTTGSRCRYKDDYINCFIDESGRTNCYENEGYYIANLYRVEIKLEECFDKCYKTKTQIKPYIEFYNETKCSQMSLVRPV